MADLIDRQEAIAALLAHRKLFCENTPESFSQLQYGEKCRVDELDNAIAKLLKIPTAERRGKWIDHQEGRWMYAKCSECGSVHDAMSNYCPNCGANMRERREDE